MKLHHMKHGECGNQKDRLRAVSTGWQNELLPSGPMALILTTPTKAGEPHLWNTPKSILVTSIPLRFMDRRGSGAHRSPRPIPQYIACDVGQSVSSETRHLSGEWLLSSRLRWGWTGGGWSCFKGTSVPACEVFA